MQSLPSAPSLLEQALEHHRRGDLTQAAALYREILEADPTNGDALNLLGVVESRLGNLENGLALLMRAMERLPSHANVRHNLANTLEELGRLEEALSLREHAAALNPGDLNLWMALAALQDRLRRFGGLLATRREILERLPFDDEGARARLLWAGTLFLEDTYGTEGHAVLLSTQHRLVAARPDRAEEHALLGLMLQYAGRLDEAVASLEAAVARQPSSPILRHYLGMALLAAGRIRRGLEECEWRHAAVSFRAPDAQMAHVPVWDGSNPAGGPMLLMAEAGLGDTLQYIRYALRLAEMGAQVWLVAQPPLARFLGHALAGYPHILINPPAVPLALKARCQTLSLYYLMGGEEGNIIPADIPYLSAEPERVAAWRSRLEGLPGRRIGLSWWGGERNTRSVAPESLAPLAEVPGVSFVSLHREEDKAPPPPGLPLTTLGPNLDADGAFVDTAAVMMNLDLIITHDTSIAHLAGALGKPVWVLLKQIPDCRWGLTGDTTPWYPNMRLFRQPAARQWGPVIRDVAEALRQFSGKK